MRSLRVALAQTRIGQSLEKNLDSAKNLLEKAEGLNSKVVCLPEYFSFPSLSESVTLEHVETCFQESIAFLEQMSFKTNQIIVGGTIPEIIGDNIQNVCFVYDSGKRIARIEKQKIIAGESRFGIIPGTQTDIFKVGGVPSTVRICADILFPETCFGLRNKINLLFIPLISPIRDVDPTKKHRNCLFITRAFDINSYVLKTGAVGQAPLTGRSIAGRSLIASPTGIITHSQAEDKEELLTADLDIKNLCKYDIISEMFPNLT